VQGKVLVLEDAEHGGGAFVQGAVAGSPGGDDGVRVPGVESVELLAQLVL
jgi:hypothetical protein